jgi:hypothetical protein
MSQVQTQEDEITSLKEKIKWNSFEWLVKHKAETIILEILRDNDDRLDDLLKLYTGLNLQKVAVTINLVQNDLYGYGVDELKYDDIFRDYDNFLVYVRTPRGDIVAKIKYELYDTKYKDFQIKLNEEKEMVETIKRLINSKIEEKINKQE